MLRNKVLDLMNQHQSIRSFTDQPVSDEQVAAIIHAATSGPNMQNYQPVSFIEITDPAFKSAITKAVGMKYIETATRYFVVLVDFHKDLIGLSKEEQTEIEDKLQYYQLLEGGIVSAAIALGRAQIAAESLGLGTVTMAGAMGAHKLYEEHLNLPKYVKPVMGFSMGYPNQNPGVKPKLPLAGTLMQDGYQEAQMTSAISEYNQTMKTYFAQRGMDTDWTHHNLSLFKKMQPDVGLSQYPQQKGFNLK